MVLNDLVFLLLEFCCTLIEVIDRCFTRIFEASTTSGQVYNVLYIHYLLTLCAQGGLLGAALGLAMDTSNRAVDTCSLWNVRSEQNERGV